MVILCIQSPTHAKWARQAALEEILQRAGSTFSVKATVRHRAMSATHNEPVDESAGVGEEAPGQAITHYAPAAPTVIVRAIAPIESGKRVSLLFDPSSQLKLTMSLACLCTEASLQLTGQELAQVAVIDFGGRLSRLAQHALGYRDLSPRCATTYVRILQQMSCIITHPLLTMWGLEQRRPHRGRPTAL